MRDTKPQSFEEFLAQTESANVIPVVKTLRADLLTPLAVYLKLSHGSENSFLFESVEGGENLARYSFIGAAPQTIVGGNARETIVESDGAERTYQIPLFDFLRGHFAGDNKIPAGEEYPPLIGGAIGFFNFSCAGWFEKTLEQSEKECDGIDARFMFFSTIVAFDHAKQTINIISLVSTDEVEDDRQKLETLFENALSANEKIRKILEDEPVLLPKNETRSVRDRSVRSNWTREDFENAVVQIKELINAGECYQVVLSQCLTRETDASPVSIYRVLRQLNPSPYMFLLQVKDESIIGASPEMLVRCIGRKLEYRPIAGTRPRGKSAEEDAALADEMRMDEKEVAEHLMLVDLGRNDLGRVAEYGSVTVENLMSVEKYSHVQHLVSYLKAELRDDCDRFDALAACFPAGTVSGAPKVRAIEIIKELEPTERGIYAGAVGYIDYSGNLDVCIAIRTLVLKNGTAKIQAGAGIVADSVPSKEFDETINKAKALMKTIEIAETQI